MGSGGIGKTVGAQAPVDDLGLVDEEAMLVVELEAGPLPHRTVDVDGPVAPAAYEVVVVVADPVLEPRR